MSTPLTIEAVAQVILADTASGDPVKARLEAMYPLVRHQLFQNMVTAGDRTCNVVFPSDLTELEKEDYILYHELFSRTIGM